MRALLLSLGLALWSCSEPEPADARAEPFEVQSEQGPCSATVELAAGAAQRGVNRFLVGLSPAEVELVGASGLMVAHGHGSEGNVVSGDPNEVSIDLFMTGRWDLTLEVNLAGAADEIAFSIDVP